ncbi:MAG TPA: cytochrome P450 [Thermoleophilaceae bacterium]|nr:cytochrome P450 [Thermoleophilaceae bacterium]
MALVTDLELPVLDYLAPDLNGERFHQVIAEVRARSWLATSPIGFIVLDREAGSYFLRTKSATFPGMRIAEMFEVPEGPLLEQMRRNILHVNGEAHGRLRGLVNPAFTPRAADGWRPAMREFLERLWAPLADASRCEFVADFAKPYPSLTIATVMGAPLDDAPKLHEWSNVIQGQFDPNMLTNERAKLERACAEFYEWASALIERRRDDPGDDLISTLIAAEEAGDRLSDVECMNLVLNVLVGGVDTTQSQLAHGLRVFATRPEQWDLLASDSELVPHAVEELLRYEPITPFTARLLHEEVEYRGVTFPADTVVMVCSFAGNRDGVEGDPEAFDITAARGPAKPLTFGAGIHYCLGANLARAELQEALRFLPQRMPGLELEGEPELGSIHGVYGLNSLPIRWNTA